MLANVADAGFGAAIVHADYPAAWGGWAAIAIGPLLLLAARGDTRRHPGAVPRRAAVVGVALLLD